MPYRKKRGKSAAFVLICGDRRLGEGRTISLPRYRSPFEALAPGLPFLGASSILADATICLGISARGKLAGSVPGAQRRKTILNPVVVDPRSAPGVIVILASLIAILLSYPAHAPMFWQLFVAGRHE